VSQRPTIILHADMDAFYASVEQRDNPELRGKPVIVGGLGGRGVVTAASYEARPFGVHSAMPTAEARKLCPHAVFLPGRMRRYAEVSREIFTIFEEFTPEVEPLSLDEAFLDVTASMKLFPTPAEVATRLRARVRAETDLAVSVGIGPTKMVAKIASGRAKPDGILEVRPENARSFLAPLSVDSIWGVGPVTHRQLRAAGIETIADLAAADPRRLQEKLGRMGLAFQALARGEDARSVDPERERKSYGEENTFATDMTDGDDLRRTIVTHAESVARRLRADGRRARTVVLKLKLTRRIGPGKYPLLTRSATLAEPTDDGKAISDTALALWHAVAPGMRIRLIGVSVSGIEERSDAQLSLLDPVGRRGSLNRALDAIAARFGDEAVSRGGAHVERAAPTLAIKDKRKRET
jgi:DNA polymerase-4